MRVTALQNERDTTVQKVLSLTLKRIRRYGGLAIQQVLGRAEKISQATITGATIIDGCLVLSGRIVSNCELLSCGVTLRKFRQEEMYQDIPMQVTQSLYPTYRQRILRLLGVRCHDFSVRLDIDWNTRPASIYGIGYTCDADVKRLKLAKIAVQILTDAATHRTYCLFNDPAVPVPRIEMYHFGPDVVTALHDQAAKARPPGLRCIVGEYTNTARDNGRVLFEGLRKEASDIEVAYVIEAENADNYSVDQPDVLTFGSPAHLAYCLDAHVCAFTHHRSYVYPYILRLLAPTRYQTARGLFLQHGIIAMKKSIVAHYHYQQIRYDGFCVSSQEEKNIIISHFGYPADRVHVTGLPRFDRLFEKIAVSSKTHTHVLVFPTWRAGFDKKTSVEISQTPFVKLWRQALTDLRAAGIKTHLIVHPLMARHESLFATYADRTSHARYFQDALMQSNGLITDYSSVSFDALFVRKPVFLFQFSEDPGSDLQDAFVDIETQSPGQISTTPDALVEQLVQAQTDQWAFTRELQHKKYFAAHDAQNAVRVANIIRLLAADLR